MKFDLIQTGKFKSVLTEEIKGLDTTIDYEYMGRAEFEFGAKQDSLRRMVLAYYENRMIFTIILIRDVPFFVFHNKKDEASIKDIEDLFNHPSNYRTLEPIAIEHYFEGEKIERLKRNCKKKREVVNNYSYVDFWWDLDNDYFVLPSAPYYREHIQKAMNCLKEKWHGKKIA